MMEFDIEKLGFTKAELFDRVVDNISDQLIVSKYLAVDEYGEGHAQQTAFAKAVKDRVTQRVDEAVEKVANKYTLPEMEKYLEEMVIQQTNHWGEKVGESKTFIEHLTNIAKSWFSEPVNYQGKTKAEDKYNWSKHTTRAAHMVEKHLDSQIRIALENAFKDLNKGVADGLSKAVNMELQKVLKRVEVQANLKKR